VNLLLSRTNASNSDGAAQVLQGWQMPHGHVRLHDWLTGDVTSVRPRCPSTRGLSPDVIHVAGSKNLLSDIPWVQPAYLP
jgi:hypothetical protein